MSLTEPASSTFEAAVEYAPPGLVGMITVRIEDDADTAVYGPTAAGITEVLVGNVVVYRATLEAPADPGNYYVVWQHGTETAVESLTVTNPNVPAVEWRPSTKDVARLLVERLGRAIDDNSLDGDDFSTSTRPTKAQVEQFIDVAVTDVVARVRVPIIASQAGQAGNVAAYWASVLAEASLVPGGAQTDEVSVAPQYTGAYVARLDELKAACWRWNSRLV